MADFRTHLSVAAVTSGLTVTSFLVIGVVSQLETILFFFVGILGGFLPDIDSDNSVPVKLTFSFFAIISSFLVMFSQGNKYSVIELILIWIIVYLFVRIILFRIFAMTTVHRGIFHSVPSGILFCFLITIIMHNICNLKEFSSWMAGFFVFWGYLIHLFLDEIYNVDLLGSGLKRSFGAAVKIISLNDLKSTVILYMVTIGVFFFTPDFFKFLDVILDYSIYEGIGDKFFPRNGWFKGILP